MDTEATITVRPGQVISGPLFSESMRVKTVSANGPDFGELGLVGHTSGRFSRVRLTAEELRTVSIASVGPSYDGTGALRQLGLQAHSLGIADGFDPYFALSMARVDPLPHQLEASMSTC